MEPSWATILCSVLQPIQLLLVDIEIDLKLPITQVQLGCHSSCKHVIHIKKKLVMLTVDYSASFLSLWPASSPVGILVIHLLLDHSALNICVLNQSFLLIFTWRCFSHTHWRYMYICFHSKNLDLQQVQFKYTTVQKNHKHIWNIWLLPHYFWLENARTFKRE